MKMNRRDFTLSAGAVTAAALAPGNAFAATGGELDEAYLSLVHPELRDAARAIAKMVAQLPPYSDATIASIRTAMSGIGSGAPAGDYREVTIEGPGGRPTKIYVINEKPGTSRPAILHTHGGGFITGTAKQSIPAVAGIAKALDYVAVTVEYDLAPEATYKVSSEQNYAGLKWLHSNAAAIGGDPKRIAVMGESAGGGHAALLAIIARDRGEVPIAFQCLIQPELDDRTGSSRRVPGHIGRFGWTEQSNRYAWQSFLGQTPGTASVPASAVPARTENLAGLPPALIAVGSLDLFVDESITYAKRLIDARVRTELVVVPGAFHGFDVFAPASSLAKQAQETKLNAFKRELS